MENLMKEIKQFNEERDWGKFHTPENLAKSGVRIDIWTHLMRGCIIELCTLH